ncbi:MAG: hypothetical protein P8L85_13165 [Rubripirellula sp.]|nr:hypothetical protein [Rubripirellula sp.]
MLTDRALAFVRHADRCSPRWSQPILFGSQHSEVLNQQQFPETRVIFHPAFTILLKQYSARLSGQRKSLVAGAAIITIQVLRECKGRSHALNSQSNTSIHAHQK